MIIKKLKEAANYVSMHKKSVGRVGFAVLAQGLIGLMSVLTSFVLPARIGPEEYGYYQEFFFYLSYLNVLGIGVNDGIALNYAGMECSEEKKRKIRSALFIQIGYIIIATIVFCGIALLQGSLEKKFIVILLSANILPTIIICVESGIFLAENKSYIYNLAAVLQKTIFCLLLVLLLVNKIHYYRWIILSQTLTNYLIAIVFFFWAKDYYIGRLGQFQEGFKELGMLSSTGIMVALSVAVSGLIPSFGRIIVEHFCSISEYGIYSFYISLLSIVLSFTSAVGIVVFPIIRNTKSELVKNDYQLFDKYLSIAGLGIYLLYPILYLFIKYFLKDYYDGIGYLGFLLPICYPIAKIQILMTPYYKMYRKEKQLLAVNAVSLVITVALNSVAYLVFRNTMAIAMTSLVSCDFYYALMRRYLPREVKKQNSVWELAVQAVFVGGIVVGGFFYK
ncbi:MAG: hypothetical protein K5669_02395 [Lachnospiraceae bacterium]|nr:hypothetical protein [Lachnospiraceae bacterium]